MNRPPHRPVAPAAALLAAALLAVPAAAEQLTIVLTNDTHSFLGAHGDLGRFGGYARVATIVDQIRASTPNVLVVDGGDWVEGTFFFRLNDPAAIDPIAWPGTPDLYLKNLMGYDVTVIGNHDIIDYNRTFNNGNPAPTTVLDRLSRAGTLRFPILCYNFDPAALPSLDPYIVNEGDTQPFARFDVNGVTVAVGGVTTDLFVYQMYLTDGSITAPDVTRVQGLLDAMNATSPHLTLLLNHVGLLADADLARTTSGLDVIVGGHSHHFLLNQQMETGTGGDPVAIVQAGSRGMFVGRLDLDIDDVTKDVTVRSYQLIPIDRNVAEKPAIAAEVARLRSKVVAKNGPVFTDTVATMDVDCAASKWESSVGNLLVDAVFAKARPAPYNADLCFISNGVVSNPGNTGSSEVQVLSLDGFRKGTVRSEDVYRVFGNGYNPVNDRNYRIFTVDLLGADVRFIQEVFNFSNLVQSLPAALFVNMAGGTIVHDPTLPDFARIVSFDVGGSPLVDTQTYTVAVDEGALQLIDYLIDSGLLQITYANKQSTGIEVWTALKDHLAASTPVGITDVDVEGRYRTVQPDLSIQNYDVTFTPATWNPGDTVTIGVTVRNFGNAASGTSTLEAYLDLTPFDWSDDPRYDPTTRIGTVAVPALGAFPATRTATITWNTASAPAGSYPVYLRLVTTGSEPIATNQFAFDYSRGFQVPWRLLGAPGAGPANAPRVRVLEGLAAPATIADFAAYGATGFGANVAGGDVDGTDDEALTGPGPGAVYGPQIRGFRQDGTPVAKINAYAYGTLKYGVNVAGGDPDGDVFSEIVTGAGPGAVFGPHVRAFNYDGIALSAVQKINFFAYGTLKYGVEVAAGDMDRDGFGELLTGPGPSAAFGPQVRGFNYDLGTVTALAKVNFNAFTSNYGARVDAGDVEGDGFAEILAGVGPGPTLVTQVRGFNWDGGTVAAIGAVNFVAFPAWRYGARPSSGDVDADAIAEILATPGQDPAAEARVRGYDHDGGPTTPVAGLDVLMFDPERYGARAGVAALAP